MENNFKQSLDAIDERIKTIQTIINRIIDHEPKISKDAFNDEMDDVLKSIYADLREIQQAKCNLVALEIVKCKADPYYFATTYLKFNDKPFLTPYSPNNFNEIVTEFMDAYNPRQQDLVG